MGRAEEQVSHIRREFLDRCGYGRFKSTSPKLAGMTLLNVDRARDHLSSHNLNAIIATTATNVTYLTGYDCWQYKSFRENMLIPGGPNTLVQSYAVLTPKKRALITSGYMGSFPAEGGVETYAYGDSEVKVDDSVRKGTLSNIGFVKKMLSNQEGSPAEALAKSLNEFGVSRGRVGVEFKEMNERTKVTLRKRFPKVQFLDATELIRFIRMVKTQEEVARLRAAAEASEGALKNSLGNARADATLASIRSAFLTTLAENGAYLEHWTYSPDGFGLTDNENARLKRGMFTLFDVGCIYKSYYSDTGTTLVVGKLSEVVKTYRTLFEIVDECLDTLRPGATPSSVLAAFSKAYRSRGMKGVNYQGHGIGLETREHPVIAYSKFKKIADDVVSQSIDIPLEQDMAINIETPLDVLGRGGYQVERTFLLGKRSVSEITPKRDALPYIIAK